MRLSPRMLVSSILSLLVILVLGLGFIVSEKKAARAASPTITLSPTSGAPSTNVTVNGTDFISGDAITINFDTTQVGTATAATNGTFTMSFTVPTNAQTNNHTVSAVGTSSGTAQASFLVPANWPTIGFDAQQDHFNPVENILSASNVSQLAPYWNAATNSGLSSEPVEANGLVYVDETSTSTSTPGSFVYAFDSNTGASKWRYQLTNSSYSFGGNSVAVDTMNGVVFAAAGISTGQNPGGLLIACNATCPSFGPLWTTSTGSASTSPVVTYETINGTLTPVVYVGTVDKLFYKINGTNGNVIWTASLGGVTDAPSIANGQVFVGSTTTKSGVTSSKVQVLDSATGKILWSRQTVGTVTGQTVVNGVLYISTMAPANSCGPDVYAANTTSSPPDKLLWEYPAPPTPPNLCNPGVQGAPGISYSSIAVANGNVYVGSGDQAATSGFSVFAAAGCGNGITVCAPIWSAANGGSSSNLTVANGVVYTAFSDNSLRAFDATGCGGGTSCSALWTNTGSSSYGNGIAVINGVVYAGIVSGTLNAFNVFVSTGSPAISLTGLYYPINGVPSGPPSSTITVSGQNFGDAENVTITMGTIKASAQTQAGGFSTTLPITGTTLPNTYTVKAVGGTSGRTAQAPFLVQTNWYNFGFDSQRSHYNPYENILTPSNVNSQSLKLKWPVPFSAQNYVTTSPAVADGYIYIASADHKLYALNAKTGKSHWAYNANNPIYASPTVANGVVYVFDYNSTLHALDASTKAQLWSVVLGNPKVGYANQSSPVVVNGVIYIGSSDHNLYALDATNKGAQLWKAATGGPINASPAVANGVVYAGSTDGNLYALDATSGAQLWTATTGGPIMATPTVANGNVYVGSTDGTFYVYNASGCGKATCSPTWTFATMGPIYSSAAAAKGVVYVGSFDGKLYVFNATTGNLIWSAPTGSSIDSSPSVANGVVYVGSDDNNLYAFTADGCGKPTCSPIWTYTTGSKVKSSPTIANGYIYFGSYDFKVYAFGI